MRNIFILIALSLFLSLFGHSQTKSHWGKIIKDATDTRVSNLDVDLYEYNGDSLYQLVENDTIPGYYYFDSVAVGMYDLYIDGVKKLPGIWIGANILSKLAANLQSNGQLIGSSGIKDRSITAVKIGTGVLTSTELGANSVGSSEITDGSVTTAEVLDGTLKEADYSNSSVTSNKIVDSTIVLQDINISLKNYIDAAGGGSITNNPDNVSIENKTGSTIGVKESYLNNWLSATDTTVLDSKYGKYTYLLTLGGINWRGGGGLQRALKSDYPIDNIISFVHGNTDSVWVRQNWVESKVLSTDWAGITYTDSVANPTKWATLWSRAIALNASEIVFPPGTFQFDDSISVSQNGSGSAAFPWIHGAGAGAAGVTTGSTILEFTGNTNGIVVEDGFMPRISDLKIINALGKNGNTGIGIRIMKDNGVTNGSLLGQVYRCDIEQWFVGLHLSQPNSILIESNYIRDNKIGVREINAPNEIVYIANYIAFNDSIQVYKNAGNKSTIIGGSISGPSGVSQDYGVYVDNAGKIALFGVSSERCGHSVIYAGTNTWVEWNSGGGTYSATNTNRFATVNGGNLVLKGRITFSDVPVDTHAIWQSGTASRVYADQTATMRTKWTNYNLTYYPNNHNSIPASGTISADSTTRGKVYWRISDGASYSDKPYVIKKMVTGGYVALPYTAGDDWLRSTNFSNQPNYTATTELSFRTFGANVTMSGGDSTVFTTVVDTNGWTYLGARDMQVDLSNTAFADSVYNWNILGLDANGAAGTGTITWIVHHPFYSGTGTFNFGGWAIITPRKWTR